MSSRVHIAEALARAMLGGVWNRRAMLARCAQAVGDSGIWLRALVDSVLVRFSTPPHEAQSRLVQWILDHEALSEFRRLGGHAAKVTKWFFPESHMRVRRWPVRELHTAGDLEQWLQLSTSDLAWFADRRGLERHARDARMQNYVYRWVEKASGGQRLLEAPKQRLKALQRSVLRDILDAIPPHDAAHGFRAGRSVLTHARLHSGNATVIRLDLSAFFAHVPTGRALGVFLAAGYPEEVAKTLIALCTNVVPMSVLQQAKPDVRWQADWNLFRLKGLLRTPHLPQGAPTSPALANLAAFGMDVRLTGLARRYGATYSRYADDLTFSGDRTLAVSQGSLQRAVERIAREEGFRLNPFKGRVMVRSRRQIVTGAVVNAGVNVPRDEYDILKATLHNCVRTGFATQARGALNFEQQLQGRVAWVEALNPQRGAKLRALLAKAQKAG